ncbi:hypothetical protein [Sphingopyxis sp. JAI128]|uniref:hypothetical protein n=1 Tax=Sphingopyxis sp. JAI128 TaxID=2723066 RepID=UPI00162265DB|nr:hypothetical protein [Sphingopyxis sp. JAI128]MBB6427163.1 hypothetical protein [Sphingopyxis sp. JAI128]
MNANRTLAAAVSAAMLLFGPAPAAAHGDGDHVDRSDDPHWALFETVAISQAPPDYRYHAAIPARIEAIAGQEMTISGYAVSLGQEAVTDHFLLSRYSPECPYHAASRPNEMVEVRLANPVRLPLGREIRITGRFGLQQNGYAGLFFRLDGGAQS